MKVSKKITAVMALATSLAAIGCSDSDSGSGPSVDPDAPVITVVGKNPDTLKIDQSYFDLGVTITDAQDGAITDYTTTTNLDSSTVGSYTISYKAKDSDNNESIETRTVHVVSTMMEVELTAGLVLSDANVIYSCAGGYVSGDLTIGSGVTLYTTGDIDIDEGKLTIMDGAVIKIAEGKQIEIGDNAEISVEGTATKPVTFTNLEENKMWGTASTTWYYNQGLHITSSAATGSVIDYAIFENSTNGIYCEREGGLTLTNSTFRNCTVYGAAFDDKSSVKISGNSFTGNGGDILVSDGIIPTMTADNSLEIGVEVLADAMDMAGTIPSLTYLIRGKYRIEGNELSPEPVTIAAGAEFLFDEDAYLYVYSGGNLLVEGTAASPVTFKNAQPGKRWGASNGTWYYNYGIMIGSDAATGNKIEYAVIDSATTGVYCERENGLTLLNSTITNSSVYGFAFEASNSAILVDGITASGNLLGDGYCATGCLTKLTPNNNLATGISIPDDCAEIGGIIPSLTYILTGKLRIEGNALAPLPVTIAAGATFKCMEDAEIQVSSGGQLIVAGTADSMVTFKNAQEGKFWGESSSTWYYNYAMSFLTDAAVDNEINYAVFQNATTGIYNECDNAGTISNSQFLDYQMYGVSQYTHLPMVLTGNTFSSTVATALDSTHVED